MSRTYEQLEPVIHALDKRIKTSFRAFPTDTASGAIASFSDGADNAPVKSLVVGIELVQEGNGDPSPDNVRPIIGWTGAKVTRTGKNLLPYPYSSNSGTYNGVIFTKYEDGTINCSGTATDTVFFNLKKSTESFLLKAGTYVINGAISGSIVVVRNIATNLRVGDTSNNNGIFTLAKDTEVSAYIRIEPGNSVNGIVKPMIRLATESDAEYEPYSGQTYDITFPSEAGTVYGGTLDVTNGVLTVDRAGYVFDGTESYWKRSPTYRGSFYYEWSSMPAGAGIVQRAFTCSHAGYVSTFSEYAYGKCGSDSSLNLWVMQDPDATIDDLKAFLAEQYANETPVTVCYTLATPITYQLTPHQINSLLGANNIWADTGDSSVEYRADTKLYIERLTEPDADMVADSNIVSGQYFMVGNNLYKATANIASGASVIVGTNCTQKSLATALNEINQ